MKSRAALLLSLVTLVAAQASATTSTTEKLTTTSDPKLKEISKNISLPVITTGEKLIVETTVASKLLPNSRQFFHPFKNPQDIMLQEIRSLDEDASTSKQIQDELAKAIKAEAQKSRDKPRVSSTQKPRVRVTSSSPNALLLDAEKTPVKTNINVKEALKALNQAETELAFDEDNMNNDDDDDDDDDDEDDEDEDDEDDAYDDDEDAIGNGDEDDIADEEELMTDCPDYCRCSGQYAAATTARCSKLTEKQNFGPGIAHLRIENAVDINLGPRAIRARGLQQLESITIVDTKLSRLDRTAFNGTDYLFAVNLSRNGLRELESDYFVNNTQLSLLTISGQLFGSNWYKSRDYILDSGSIAELDFSDNSVQHLPRGAFAKMPNLAFVDLKNNRLRNIEKTIFESIETLVELDLSGNLFNEFPDGIFEKGLQTLRISSNNLTSIRFPRASKLTNLDASHNRIKYITKDDLIGAGALEKLTVSSNGLKRIHQHSFSELDQLTYLDISDNKLTSLDEHHLRSNSRLQIIIMNNNPELGNLPVFKAIGYETYAVHRFECSNCGLDTLTEGTFDSMPALMRLNLAKNRLARLPSGLLKSMSSLRELDLSDNMINTLEPKMFLGAHTLLKLNLAGNTLRSLQVTPFLQTPGLSRLDVSRCQLQRIWSEARQPLKNLRFISVRGNELKRITLEELKATPKLSGLDASHNPFSCDEEFNLAIQWLIDHGVTPSEVPMYISNYGTAGEDYNEGGGVSHWTDLARHVCEDEDEGPPSRNIPRKPIDDVPTFTAPSDDNVLLSTGIDGLADLEFVHGRKLDEKLDDIWRDQYQEYEDVITSKDEENLEVVYSSMRLNIWPILTVILVTLTLIILVVQFARMMSRAKGRGPVIRPPMMLRQGLVDNKNCGLVYKPLQEEIATPHMPKRGSFYSSSTFHYDKIVPESV